MRFDWERHPFVTRPELSKAAEKVFDFILANCNSHGHTIRIRWSGVGGLAAPANKLAACDKRAWFDILEELRYSGLLRFDDREGGNGYNSNHALVQPIPVEPEDRAIKPKGDAIAFARLLDLIPDGFRTSHERLEVEQKLRNWIGIYSGKSVKDGFWWQEGAKVLMLECELRGKLAPRPSEFDPTLTYRRFVREFENVEGFSEALHLGRQLKIIPDGYRVHNPNRYEDGPTYFAERQRQYLAACRAIRSYLQTSCHRSDAATMSWPMVVKVLKDRLRCLGTGEERSPLAVLDSSMGGETRERENEDLSKDQLHASESPSEIRMLVRHEHTYATRIDLNNSKPVSNLKHPEVNPAEEDTPRGQSSTKSSEPPIPPRARSAEELRQKALIALDDPFLSDSAAYEWLRSAREAFEGDGRDLGVLERLPSQSAFLRNLGTYRKCTGTQKRRPRRGREDSARSVVRDSEI